MSKQVEKTAITTIFDKNSIFCSLRLQSKFSLEEQKQLNLIEKTGFIYRLEIKPKHHNSDVYLISGSIRINNSHQLTYFSSQLKDEKYVQYWLNFKESLAKAKNVYQLMQLRTVNLSAIIE